MLYHHKACLFAVLPASSINEETHLENPLVESTQISLCGLNHISTKQKEIELGCRSGMWFNYNGDDT